MQTPNTYNYKTYVQAMFMQFNSNENNNYAVKVGIGGINGATGTKWKSNDLTMKSNDTMQNYIPVPYQTKLYGINENNGYVKQFVATTLKNEKHDGKNSWATKEVSDEGKGQGNNGQATDQHDDTAVITTAQNQTGNGISISDLDLNVDNHQGIIFEIYKTLNKNVEICLNGNKYCQNNSEWVMQTPHDCGLTMNDFITFNSSDIPHSVLFRRKTIGDLQNEAKSSNGGKIAINIQLNIKSGISPVLQHKVYLKWLKHCTIDTKRYITICSHVEGSEDNILHYQLIKFKQSSSIDAIFQIPKYNQKDGALCKVDLETNKIIQVLRPATDTVNSTGSKEKEKQISKQQQQDVLISFGDIIRYVKETKLYINGLAVTTKIDSSETVSDMITKWCEDHGRDIRHKNRGLEFNGKKLEFNKKLSDYPGIDIESSFTLCSDLITITIKISTGKTITIEADVLDSVDTLKKKIQEKDGIPHEQQRLVVAGKGLLQDNKCLLDYKIQNDSVVHLVLRLRGGCFIGNTKVLLSTNKQVNIKNIKENIDCVVTYDFKNKKFTRNRVQKRLKYTVNELVNIKLTNGEILSCTPTHPIYSTNKQRWCAVKPKYVNTSDRGMLTVGDYVMISECHEKGDICQVSEIEFQFFKHNETLDVYTLTVENNHNFFANGVLVHNTMQVMLFFVSCLLILDYIHVNVVYVFACACFRFLSKLSMMVYTLDVDGSDFVYSVKLQLESHLGIHQINNIWYLLASN